MSTVDGRRFPGKVSRRLGLQFQAEQTSAQPKVGEKQTLE